MQSKSPKKDKAQHIDADPEMRKRAKKAQVERSKKKENILDKYSYHIVFAVFAIVITFGLVSAFWKSGPNVKITDVNDQAYISGLNEKGLTFKVGAVDMFNGYKLIDAKYLIGSQATNKQQLYRCSTGNQETIVPEAYNFREAFPDCAGAILTQGNCSSSYALSSVSAITDRWCRSSKQSFPYLSPNSPIACDKVINNNCRGGYVSRTLDYAKIYGLVDNQCYPYSDEIDTPENCQKAISECEKYKIADYCVSEDEQNIKQQIFNHGPVITVIPVYRDFLIYKSGVYKVYPRNQKFNSGHAIKIIGWDVIDGQNCWLVENTWGDNWGMDGIGCIMANQDELRLERFTIAPALNTEEIEQREQVELEGEDVGTDATEHQEL